MKNLLSLTLLTFLLISCGDNKEQSIEDIIATDNLETIRQKRATIVTQQQEINNKIKQLDDKISELDKSKKIPLITTFTVQQEVFNHYLELQGSVQTKQNLVIYSEIPGILLRVYVKEGQRVSKGQLLASIDDGGMEQQVAQLQIQADLAKTTFERQERLWDKKIGSEIQYLQAKSSYEAQQKAVSQLKSQLEKSSVRAPFSGVIDDVISEQGSVVSPGQSQLMRIVNLRDMYIETDVPESYISSVSKNKDVLVEFPVLGKTMNAKIRQTGNFINPANRTFKIEIAVPNKDRAIKPNLTAKLKINDYTNENAILIPQDIISENANGEQYIYVVKDKNGKYAIADQVIIETGKTQGDVIEVLKGLEKNDVEIIQEGARSVRNQQEVEISNK
jgi:membrane fusion protein (multidrug efflux system)